MSILTPTIPGRERYLAECRASVLAQTLGVWEHLRILDVERRGCAAMMNELASASRGTYVLPLADDDLLLPGAVEALTCQTTASERASTVVYAPPLVWGLDDPWWFFGEPPAIPSFGLIPRVLWDEVGGYDDEWNREEDRRFWTRAIERGASFVRYDASPTWVYRFHGGNKSFHNGVAA